MEGFEDKLKRAMARADAPEGFEERVMARIAGERRVLRASPRGVLRVLRDWLGWGAVGGGQRTARPAWATAVAGGLVCLFLLGIGVGWLSWEHQRNLARQAIRGQEARAQLMLALKITGERLSRVHELLSAALSENGEKSGAGQSAE